MRRRLDVLDPMACLKDGIPLSLVSDLLDEQGPDSTWIYEHEPADLTWAMDPEEKAALAG